MVNKSGNIGTAGETGVKRALWKLGFPDADRLRLSGSDDRGDILAQLHWLIVEVKAGNSAKTASLEQIDKWLIETEVERENVGVPYAFLVTARPGYSPRRAENWWAWTRHSWFVSDLYGPTPVVHPEAPIRMTLDVMADRYRAVIDDKTV